MTPPSDRELLVSHPSPRSPLRISLTLTVLVAVVALLAATASAAVTDAPSSGASGASAREVAPAVLPEPTHTTVSEEALVEMDDGVQIAVTIVRPSEDGEVAAPGEFPVVLAMTPYSRNGVCGCFPPAAFAERGIIGVVADVRGTGGSGGDLSGNYFSPREAQDGRILVDHLGTMEGSDGRVGMAGASYVGITQYLTAAQQPEHLVAIAPMVPISDLYRDGYTHGGVPNLSFDLQYIAVQGAPGYVGSNTEPYLLEESLRAKLGQSPPGSIAFDYLARPDDDPFYRDRSPIEVADRIEVPVLTIGGWRDGLLRGQTEMHTTLAERPGVETRLTVDPCTHKGCGAPFAPLTDAEAKLDPLALTFEFLDHHLRGTPGPDRAPVEFHLQGRDAYVAAEQWPPAEVRYEELQLAPDGALVPRSTVEVDADATASYATDPAAGFSLAFNRYGTVAATPFVPTDQRLEGAQGVTFRTAPLEGPLALAGPLALRLTAASTATDTDWHVKVADVAPDGTETFVTEGALRASHRELDPARTRAERPFHTHTSPTSIEPDTFLDYEVEIWPTAYELDAGHRLQVRITSTDLPTHLPGWIAFDPDAPQDTVVHLHDPAVNTVRLADSHLLVPVLAGTLPAADDTDDGDDAAGDRGDAADGTGDADDGGGAPGAGDADGTPPTATSLPATGPAAGASLAGLLLLAGAGAIRSGRRREAC
jgi:uncharacterized protein